MTPSRLVSFLAATTAALGLALGHPSTASAAVRLPKVFGSHMVLQQTQPVIVWGWAGAGETVTVKLANDSRETKANDRGEWKVSLPAQAAGGPLTLTVTGSSTVQFDDILVGEVWLCSGQSNMEMGLGAVQNGAAEVAAANHPRLRLFKVDKAWTPLPQDDCQAAWQLCTPASVAAGGWSGFSAAGYFFGRELESKLNVAVGLIDSTWGGTRIESWTPPEGFAAVPALAADYERVQLGDPRTPAHQKRLGETLGQTEKWLAAAREALDKHALVPAMPTYPAELQPPNDVQHATALYNGMIHPLHPFAVRGAIWYQGESNAGEGRLYTERMKALIAGWRHFWNAGEFPFYFVQIAPYNYGGNNPGMIPEFWEAQAAVPAEVPHTGMAVINDIGNVRDIHPANKQEVGRRLALLALRQTYGQSNVVDSGATFAGLQAVPGALRVHFANTAGKLATRDDKAPAWFEIIDADEGGFVAATARIDGDSVELTAPGVAHPVAMRYGWSMLAEPNLVNGAGLPTGAFRAGQIPARDLLSLRVPEARQFQLLYDLDLAKLGAEIHYNVDNHAQFQKPIQRVAYFLELGDRAGKVDYVYASMDNFAPSAAQLGVPTAASGAHFQKNVAHLNVYSNVKGIVTGTNLAGGNIEFWPNNYAPANSANVPNASAQNYDFGDEPVDPAAGGYGSMQIHNHDARQTLFAINHWIEGTNADLGIGNQPTANPDWTFAANAASYHIKRLRILVQ